MIKVLLAEDDSAISEMYRFALEQEGWEVCVASDGQSALGAGLAEPPSLVLLDIEMPKLDGIEVLRESRRHDMTFGAPAIVISNSPGSQSMVETYALGLSAWAVKSRDAPQRRRRFELRCRA